MYSDGADAVGCDSVGTMDGVCASARKDDEGALAMNIDGCGAAMNGDGGGGADMNGDVAAKKVAAVRGVCTGAGAMKDDKGAAGINDGGAADMNDCCVAMKDAEDAAAMGDGGVNVDGVVAMVGAGVVAMAADGVVSMDVVVSEALRFSLKKAHKINHLILAWNCTQWYWVVSHHTFTTLL